MPSYEGNGMGISIKTIFRNYLDHVTKDAGKGICLENIERKGLCNLTIKNPKKTDLCMYKKTETIP